MQDLLDYAQIKAGKFRLNVQNFDIIDAIENVMSIQKMKAQERGIDFYIVVENMCLDKWQLIPLNNKKNESMLKKSKIRVIQTEDAGK